jgi:metacaspase-1
MSPFVPDIEDANRHEVLWSDIIEPDQAAADTHAAGLARMLAASAEDSPEGEVAADLRDVLADRAQHVLLEASASPPTISASAAVGAGGVMPAQSMQIVGPQALASIPQVECVSDFSRYLLESDIRDEVIDRFQAVARPLLENGAQVIVISHSWGTVVAYEALRRLDSDSGFSGSVATLFTVGSALSIPPVKRRLLPEAIDGQRPAAVGRWVNLNARFDIIGGHLRGNPFAVDYEYLNLEPVGCSALIPNPWCAHGSYFNRDNLAVNRDIFGFFIES